MNNSKSVLSGVIATFVLSSAFSFVLTFILKIPLPRVHDEFSYLLQADTFVHGRIANAPHPLWEHFETFHVLQQPVYASKYPPAQAAIIAIGQILWQPILGVWLSTACAAAAIFWMLAGIVPLRWAYAGAALALLNQNVLQWNWCYWGGSIPLLGGALLFGGCFRLIQKPDRGSNPIWMGIGMVILALSRPFEGAIASFLCVSSLTVVWIQKHLSWSRFIKHLLVCGGVVALGLSSLCLYNFRITGRPLTMPYVVYQKTYGMNPLFLWGKIMPSPKYNHPIMQKFYQDDLAYFQKQTHLNGYLKTLQQKSDVYQIFAWNGLILLALVAIFYAVKRNLFARHAIVLLVFFLLITFGVSTYSLPHYAAPAVPLLITITVISLYYTELWKWKNHQVGKYYTRFVVLLLCCLSLMWFILGQKTKEHDWAFRRAEIQSELNASGEKHLVIVKYTPNHSPHDEWVYNEADIDAASVVWARDMGAEKNRELLDYFKRRKTWLLEPDKPGKLSLQPLSSIP